MANVGIDQETLDAALANAALHSRFIECGMISGYNEKGSGLKNAMNIVTKRISIQGVRGRAVFLSQPSDLM